jgi:hypothetical protein
MGTLVERLGNHFEILCMSEVFFRNASPIHQEKILPHCKQMFRKDDVLQMLYSTIHHEKNVFWFTLQKRCVLHAWDKPSFGDSPNHASRWLIHVQLATNYIDVKLFSFLHLLPRHCIFGNSIWMLKRAFRIIWSSFSGTQFNRLTIFFPFKCLAPVELNQIG